MSSQPSQQKATISRSCFADGDTDMSAATSDPTRSTNFPNKKLRLSSGDEETARRGASLPDLVLDAILSHCSSVDMVRLCLVSRTWQDWAPSAERVAAAVVRTERDKIYWGLLLYSHGRGPPVRRRQRCFEYGEAPKLRRLYELEKSTMVSYHFPSLDGAAHFLRAGRGQGRGTAAELHCPNRSDMMHDSMGGLVQAVGGLTKDKVKFVQTKRTIPASTEKQYRFVVKVIYRDGSIGGRDNVFLGVVNEKYEPPYRSRDASKHNKSVKNGRFIQLPRARKDLGQREVVVGVAFDMKRREVVLDYPNGESIWTRISFAQLRGNEFRIAFRQEKYDPRDDFYGVLDIAMRELDHDGYEKLMADERATKEVRAAAAMAYVKRDELVEQMQLIVSASVEAGIADAPVKGMAVGRTAALKQWSCKPADLTNSASKTPAKAKKTTTAPEALAPASKTPASAKSDKSASSSSKERQSVSEEACLLAEESHPSGKKKSKAEKMAEARERARKWAEGRKEKKAAAAAAANAKKQLYSRYLLEKFGEACSEIQDGNIIEEAHDIIQTKYDVKSMRSDFQAGLDSDDKSKTAKNFLELQRRVDAFDHIEAQIKKRLAELEVQT